MRPDELRDLYGLAMSRRRAAAAEGCVSEETLLAVASHTATDADRVAALDHIAQCAECRAEFELLRTVTTEWAAPERRGRRLFLVAAGTAAAALVVWLVGVLLAG